MSSVHHVATDGRMFATLAGSRHYRPEAAVDSIFTNQPFDSIEWGFDRRLGTPVEVITMERIDVTTISKHNKLVTFINVFTVDPTRQQELVDLLARATEIVRRAPGFISANLHRSVDGAKVTMYAQWRSIEDYEAMRANPAPLPYLQQALTFARFEPAMYEVVETYSALINSE